MSGNPSGGARSAGEPSRPQVRYNLAALRLAQSSNGDQAPRIHVVSGNPAAPPPPTAAAAAPVAPAQGRGASYAAVAGGVAAPAQRTADPGGTAALLAALRIGGDSASQPSALPTASPPAPAARYAAPTPDSLPQSRSAASPSAAPAAAPPQPTQRRGQMPFSTAFPAAQQSTQPPFVVSGQPSAAAAAAAAPPSRLGDDGPSRRPVPMPLSAPQPQPQQMVGGMQIPLPRQADRGFTGSAFVNPFHQGMPASSQPVAPFAAPTAEQPAGLFAVPQPRPHSSAPPPSQPFGVSAAFPTAAAPQPFMQPPPQQQPQQQQQQMPLFQTGASQSSRLVPAPRTQREPRTIPGFPTDGFQPGSVPYSSAPPPPGMGPMAGGPPSPPQQQHQQQYAMPLPASQPSYPPAQPMPQGFGVPRHGPPTPNAPPAVQTPAPPAPFSTGPMPASELASRNLYSHAPMQTGATVPMPQSMAAALSSGQPTPSPPQPAASGAANAALAGGMPGVAPSVGVEQLLQRMGIPAHLASAQPANATAAQQQLQQQQQQQLEQRQAQQVPLNFYTAPGGGRTNTDPQRYGQQRNGRGGGRQHYDPSHQPQQPHPRQQRGRGGAVPPGYTPNSRAQPAPVSHLTAPDPEMVQRFKAEYAQQEDGESVSDELKAQQASKHGTVGTLDEEVCLSLIERHDVTFVVTDTGTGKSTRIPIALHKAHPDALIVNAQPRRTAAINLAQRVAEVLGAKLGEGVGYSVRGEHIGDLGETKVMYVTTYSLFIYFLWHEFKQKLPFTYVIVDEFHERTPDVEVILLMLKLWLKKHPGAFKLVLCSATAQLEEWHSFFDGLSVGTYARSPIMYPVREYFIEDLQRLVGFRTAPIAPQDSNNMVASEQMHQLILVCKQLLEYLAKNTATQDSVLVFMPGRTQVELMTTWIRDNLEESLEPIAWYRDVELSVIQEALARSAVTRKKVYVATDIAEVSLTLPDVVFVIDSGTGKRPQVSAKEQTSYAFPPLRLLWETASNAQQRRGRVGRVQQGFYLSLLSREHHAALRETENRIKNAVLTELVLHSLLITRKPFAFFQLCNERPEKGALSYSLHLLQDGGLIIAQDDPLAEAERVALDRQHSSHVMDSPWNVLIEEALSAAAAPADEKETAGVAAEAAAAAADSEPVAGSNGSGEGQEEAEGEDEDPRIPEAEGDAFQQCYYITLRGVIAARSPVSVSAATNIFYGLLCGTPTLSMLAAAIESSKSPFHVPYTINDRVERAGMVRAVSQVMQRYHGSLQSDLICAMEVILEYMSMQRDGLSEEAQEEWCQERSVSRTRVVDTLNLFAQMKEQVSSVLPFPDVTDIDVLTAQFNQNAELLVLMLVASHTELAIQVQLDGPVAQQKGFVGHGMFFPLKCLKDESVPTVCPWERTKISVPLSLQTIQRKVLAVFSSQVEPDLFALVVLVFSFKLRYTVLDGATPPSYLMSVSHSGVRRTFQCDVLTAQQILQLRRIQCAQLRCMQLQVEERVKASESERLSALLRSAKSDFGLPDSAVQTPYLIPTVLQHGLKLLVNRLRSSPSFTAQRRPITDFPAGTAYCKLQHSAELTAPILQSVLIHSSNGLSVVEPAPGSPQDAAAPPAGAPSDTPNAAGQGDGEEAGEERRSASADEVEEDMSDKSSESSHEEHVAKFSYDF